ncbi:MAG: efflux RND transporter periplasmic adaptor subunit [Anaerolineales bacterium]|nr:efflux RND transporter periplasmic adaptor subunit [Anaerolineales bacterium]
MKKTVYIVLAVVGVLAVAAILYLVLSPRSSSNALNDEIETKQIDIGPVSEIVGATGTVSSDQSALLNWKTSGLVADIYYKVGDVVQPGDVLAELDPGSLSPLDILAQAELVAAQKVMHNLLESQTQSAMALQSVETARHALDDALNPVVDQSSALQAIAVADKAVSDAGRRLNTLTAPVSQAALDQAQANLVLKEKKLEDNQQMIDRIQKKLDKRDDQYKPWESRRRYRQFMNGLEIQRNRLQIDYENSLQKYEDLKSPPHPNDLALAEADLLDAQAQLLEAERSWQRMKDGVSPADLALLEARLADAQREYERIKDGPTAQDITAAQARVIAAQASLDRTSISAPFAGTITDVISQPNDQVSPGTPAFRLDDLSSLSVDVGVSEIDINLVEVGQPVILTFDAILAKQYNGRVVEVSPVGSTSLGIVDFMVRVELIDADADVRPGMTAAVEIIINQTDETLRVPNQAVKGTSLVYRVDQHGNFETIEVTIGASSDQYSQVLVGDLSPGDVIVLNPHEL